MIKSTTIHVLLLSITVLNAADYGIERSVRDLLHAPHVAASTSLILALPAALTTRKMLAGKGVGGKATAVVSCLLALDCAYAAKCGKGLNDTCIARNISALLNRVKGKTCIDVASSFVVSVAQVGLLHSSDSYGVTSVGSFDSDNDSVIVYADEESDDELFYDNANRCQAMLRPVVIGALGDILTLDQVEKLEIKFCMADIRSLAALRMDSCYLVHQGNGTYRIGAGVAYDGVFMLTTRFNDQEVANVWSHEIFLPQCGLTSYMRDGHTTAKVFCLPRGIKEKDVRHTENGQGVEVLK